MENINKKIFAFANETNELNIEIGKMGICIYFFLFAKNKKNKQLQLHAEKLLDAIYEKLIKDISLKSIPDLMQVGIGINPYCSC